MKPITTALLLRLPNPPLALGNVVRGGRRSFAAIAGVGFSLTMVLLQLGFLGAVQITATNLYEQLDFDVALLAPSYEQFYAPGVFPQERLRQAEELETVVRSSPLYVTFGLWRCPPYPLDRPEGEEPGPSSPAPGPIRRWRLGPRLPRGTLRRELLVLGVDLDHQPFRGAIGDRIESTRPALREPGRVLLNEWSHIDFGWQWRTEFSDWELGSHSVTLAGGFPLLRGFAADGAVVCGAENFVHLCDYPSTESVNVGLLNVRPGTTVETIRRLKELLPPDVVPYSRAEVLERENEHWVEQTATGTLFRFGVLVALIVASAIVYQVLSNDIRRHLPQYATLMAMGYSTGQVARVVLLQALIYMMTAYAVALGISACAYQATEALAGIPMRLTLSHATVTLFMAVFVGVLTGVLTFQKLRTADPAALFL